MPVYTRTYLKASAPTLVSGVVNDADASLLWNATVQEVLTDADLRSQKRKTALTPNLFNDVYQYSCPADLKELAIIDLKPQLNRGRFDDWRLTVPEEFDRLKKDMRVDTAGDPIKLGKNSWSGDNMIAVQDNDWVRKVLVSKPVEDSSVTLHDMDSLGSWIAFGDGTNVVADSSNYVTGSACVKYDINASGGTTAGIQNSAIPSFDLTNYLMEGSIFVWAYITSTTNLTNFKLRVGSDSSNYNTMTATTTNEGTAFYTGWQLLRFDLSGLSATGSPVNTACTYIAIYMTKSGAKISEVAYRFDSIIMRKGAHYDLLYYTKYGWQTSAGVYIVDSTDDTDLINADTAELKLFRLKYAQLAEKHLRNFAQASANFQEYQLALRDYQSKHPSEAMLLTNTYQNMYLA